MNITCTVTPGLPPACTTEEVLKTIKVVHVSEFTPESAAHFYAQMIMVQNSAQPIIPVVIDSFGGQVDALVTMVDVIRMMKKPVATIAIGKAMSCGAVLLSCGSPRMRYVAPNARVMVHDVSSGALGKAEEILSSAQEVKRLQDWTMQVLDTNCGKQSGFFNEKLKEKDRADWYMTADECIEIGIADKIGVPTLEVAVKLEMKVK